MNAPINDPLILPMVSGFGKYATDRDGATPEALTTINFYEVRDLVDKPQQGVEKDNAQWLIPSTHRSRKGHDQSGKRPLIWADVDAPVLTIKQTGDQLSDLLGGADFEVYASRSATKEKQKCRILVPLAQALTPDQWLIVSEVFRVKLAERGIETDPASEKLGQVLYLPNKGEFYDASSSCDGVLFEPLGGWPAEIAERKAELVRQAAEVKRAQEAARQRREALAARRTTQGFRSPIEAFNAAYDVSEVLTRNGYDQRGDSFRHPASATGSYSATVRTAADGVRRVNSLSTSDPLHNDGAGAHDAFSAFCVLEHGGDQNAAIKAAGDNWLTIGGESWNKVQRRERKQQQQAIGGGFPAIDLDPETGEIVPNETQPKSSPLEHHPLAQFVAHAQETPAVRWMIPGLIVEGAVTISGARGIGKTTALLPLAMAAAGLHERDYPLAPKHWRHVIYIVEDIAQAHRIIAGMVRHGSLGIKFEDVEERLHLVEAKRLPPALVTQVGKLYRERFTREVSGVELKPLVVFDTKSAVLELESENDNSEASRAVAQIRQNFEGLPTWSIGHIAKAQFGRTDVAGMSDRGAGSFEADVEQNCYLVEDKGERLFLLGKRRFEAKWTELKVESHSAEVLAVDQWGDLETTVLRWGILTPMESPRKQAREEAEKAEELKRRGDMRDAIRNAVQIAWQSGNPLSKNGVKGTVKGFKSSDVMLELEALLAEAWLHEIEVPRAHRVHPRKAYFLVNLDTPEHDAFKSSGMLPADKLEVPQSWKKSEVSIGPEVEAENPEN